MVETFWGVEIMPLQGAVAKAETLILEHLQLPGWRLCPCRLSTVRVFSSEVVDVNVHYRFFTVNWVFLETLIKLERIPTFLSSMGFD